MNLDHTPHPTIEDHYHIRMLIDGQEKRTQDRIYHQNREKALEERTKDIKDARPKDVKEFWCDECKADFFAESIKEVEVDWNNSSQFIAFYRSKCPKGHWCIRLVTDRYKDAFYFRSKKIARDRGMYFADTIQPHETGFNLLFGRKNKS